MITEPQKPKRRNKTYTAYAVITPVPADEIVRIRPNPEAPEGMAVFDTYNNASAFTAQFRIPSEFIVPVVIVRTDITEVVE